MQLLVITLHNQPEYFYLNLISDEPLFLHLQELMRETRHPAMRPALPRHRYVFPRSAFSAQGVEVNILTNFTGVLLTYIVGIAS